MKIKLSPGRCAAFSAMAIALVSAGALGASGVATPDPAESAAAGERQTVGCGAGVVEVSWHSDVESHLAIFENNAPTAKKEVQSPTLAGEHAFTTDRHTLTWGFVDGSGKSIAVDSRATCVSYH
jgi:hypothetical protein